MLTQARYPRISVESTFPAWSKKLFERLQAAFPPPPGFKPLSSDSLPPPSVTLEPVASTSTLSEATVDSSRSRMIGNAGWKWAPDCVWARLVKNERTTAKDWWQDVREIEIEVEVEGEDTGLTQGGQVLCVPSPFDCSREFTHRFTIDVPVRYPALSLIHI